jgi:secondary thiamine-phosphate synthase enzyme
MTMITTRVIQLKTKGHCDILDVTPEVADVVSDSGISSGTVTVLINGSTAAVTTIEYEPGLIADLQEVWQKLVPEGIPYHHDTRWGDGNGYAHIRASLLGASLVIPFTNKKLALGTWQQIVVLDFDNRPRSRQVILQITGE